MDDTIDTKEIQKQWKQLIKPFEQTSKLVCGGLEGVDKLEKELHKLPSGEGLAAAVEDLRERTHGLVHQVRHNAAEEFGGIEAAFIKEARDEERPPRELVSGWRLGPFELAVHRERAQARLLYNHEELIPWRHITSRKELDGLMDEGYELLRAHEIDLGEWIEVVWEAHSNLVNERRHDTTGRLDRVPILDFYREVRVTRIRRELATGRIGKKLKYAELPQWAFLYNLDCYRQAVREIDREHLLGFETGSQKEQRERKGLTLNGLDPRDEYKTFCYVTRVVR